MSRHSLQRKIRTSLTEIGFQPVYETGAVCVLEHPDRPKITVRIGVTHVALDRDGEVLTRTPLEHFQVEKLLSRLA